MPKGNTVTTTDGRRAWGGENATWALASGKQAGASPHEPGEKQACLLCCWVLERQKRKQETRADPEEGWLSCLRTHRQLISWGDAGEC